MTKRFIVAIALAIVFVSAAHAGVKDPIEGDAFNALVAAQDIELQEYLESIVPQVDGVFVTGPLDPLFEGPDDVAVLFKSVRVISHIPIEPPAPVKVAKDDPSVGGFRGTVAGVTLGEERRTALFVTVHQNRWLVWVRDVHATGAADVTSDTFAEYSRAVSGYLASGAEGSAPRAVEFDLPEAADFYPPKPDYVIQGYQNYKDYLHAHEEVKTSFARGVLGFIPGDSLLVAMKKWPPQKAWPNKEQPLFQHEYEDYFDRGGDTTELRTLRAGMLQTLRPGEYFFGVGPDGEVRFGYEIPREEIARIEKETGKKVPRANHSFLFPGEPVLTAGAFFVEATGDERRIVKVSTRSGHYFFSNVSPTIREDIALRSDEYLLTLGHFFAALERLGIDHRRVLVTKM